MIFLNFKNIRYVRPTESDTPSIYVSYLDGGYASFEVNDDPELVATRIHEIANSIHEISAPWIAERLERVLCES